MNNFHWLFIHYNFVINLYAPLIISLVGMWLFYKAFKNTWPQLYFSASDYTSLFISANPWRYFMFRLLPVILITAFVLSFFRKNIFINDFYTLSFLIGLWHGSLTNGRSLLNLLAKSKNVYFFLNYPSQILIHIISIGLILVASLLGGFLSTTPYIVKITPSFQGVVDNIWSALLSSFIAFNLYRIYIKDSIGNSEIIMKSLSQISVTTKELIKTYSKTKNADPRLVLAICVIENAQRPKWARRLERIKAIIIKSGTYGIMQVHSNRYINDDESIKTAIDKFFSDTIDEKNNEKIKAVIQRYNSDPRYYELVMDAYCQVSI